MKADLLESLRCPGCGDDLVLRDAAKSSGEVASGRLICRSSSHSYPIAGSIPRFVPPERSAESFGLQWNRFRRTQLDSHSGAPISRERFFRQTGWRPEELSGSAVLDVGCGAGRFAEVALNAGAKVVAVDYSTAVDACWQNLAHHASLDVIQGDIYNLPLKPQRFDFVYCFGVLQHTPDVERAFLSLPSQLRPGGRLAVDIYPKTFGTLLWPKYWLRPLTRRMKPDRLFGLVKKMAPVLLPFSRWISRLPIAGRKLRYAVPVMDYKGVLPLPESALREWAILDTFDMFAPTHDHPQTPSTLRGWFEKADLDQIEIFRSGLLVGRAAKRAPSQGLKCV